jgi:hypothetical protein
MKQNKYFLAAMAVACTGLMASCSSNDELETSASSEETQTINKEDINLSEVGFPGFGDMRYADEDGNAISEEQGRAALYTSAKWTNGQTIKIKFLNGTSYQQEKAKKYINQWAQYVNLKFQFVSSGYSNIAIGFKWNNDTSSWSYVGRMSLRNWTEPTMNLGWLDSSTSDKEWSRVVLHEFGHVLGLVHENQQPNANIKWNKTLVYWYYQQTQGWDKSMVDSQVFNKYSQSECNSTSFDKKSIMTYSIDFWMTTNFYYQPTVYYLSSTDKSFISSVYPK